jgi:predicted SnoaL-like aldol condensation-catalyzing enzyme
MLTSSALVVGATGCSGRSGSTSDDPAGGESTRAEVSNASRALVLEAVTALFVDFDPEAAAPLLRDDYIQHNVGVPTGAQPVLDFLPVLEESGLTATVHRVLADGDMVVLHSTYENAQLFGGETLVAFDVFRVQDGQLAEHWCYRAAYLMGLRAA